MPYVFPKSHVSLLFGYTNLHQHTRFTYLSMFASPVELGPNFNHKINKQPMKLHIGINESSH